MVVNGGYSVTEAEKQKETCCSTNYVQDKVYSFDESIDLAGSGWYGVSLLAVLSLATMAMGMDLFGFSVVVSGASCDLQLDLRQVNVLLSMPFVGPIVMSYPWGYVSDVYGRRKSLLYSLWGSFIVSTMSAFCNNWILMAVLKFISTSLSSCAQSATYTLLGESSPQRVRDSYMLIMTSVLDLMLAVYIAIAYGILNMEFTLDLLITTFRPWRLLALVLALFLGAAAWGLHFFYESPKFLLNAGREDEAIEVLRGIWTQNGGKVEEYPVKNLYLNETGNTPAQEAGFLRSARAQAAPLFQVPLLRRTLQLYLLVAVAYGTSNPYFVWFPLLAQKFFEGASSSDVHEAGLCNLVISSYTDDTAHGKCSSSIELNVMLSSTMQGFIFVTILLALSKIAHRKRAIMVAVLTASSLCGLGSVLVPQSLASFVLFFGQMSSELTVGVVYSYFVDLYPTSHRGMAACLATLVARTSSLLGIYLFGAFVMTHCSVTFCVFSGIMICGALVALFLPADAPTRAGGRRHSVPG